MFSRPLASPDYRVNGNVSFFRDAKLHEADPHSTNLRVREKRPPEARAQRGPPVGSSRKRGGGASSPGGEKSTIFLSLAHQGAPGASLKESRPDCVRASQSFHQSMEGVGLLVDESFLVVRFVCFYVLKAPGASEP